MGDIYISIVPIDVDESAVEHVELRVLTWLQEEQIVKKELTDCVLGKGLGFAPDVHYKRAIHEDSDANRILSLKTNGLEAIMSRTVFTSHGLDSLNCPNCGHDIMNTDWQSSVDDWHKGGAGLFTCNQCEKADSITEMIFSPAWAFSNIGFTFWNWGMLKDSFIKDFERIADHKCMVISGKL